MKADDGLEAARIGAQAAFDLLEYLVRNAGRAMTRQQMVSALRGECYASAKTLDMHVLAL